MVSFIRFAKNHEFHGKNFALLFAFFWFWGASFVATHCASKTTVHSSLCKETYLNSYGRFFVFSDLCKNRRMNIKNGSKFKDQCPKLFGIERRSERVSLFRENLGLVRPHVSNLGSASGLLADSTRTRPHGGTPCGATGTVALPRIQSRPVAPSPGQSHPVQASRTQSRPVAPSPGQSHPVRFSRTQSNPKPP
jgi:hypothetical protein